MVESDQSDKEAQDEAPPLEVSDCCVGVNEPTQKRPREETLDDKKIQLPAKKPCTSVKETVSEEHETKSVYEVNGTVNDANQDAKSTSASDNKEDVEDTSMPEESINVDTKEVHDAKSDSDVDDKSNSESNDKSISDNDDKSNSEDDEEACTTNNTAIEKKGRTRDAADEEQKDNTATEVATNVDEGEATVKDNETGKGEDNIKRKNKRSKTLVEDAEVVEGLELSVECASDKESSSSSDSESEKDKKPKQKTIIVKAKPNDSELDVSCSEAEKSDSQQLSEVKSKQIAKKGKKSGRGSFGKAKNTDSEENDNVSDEDYSPRTKRKLKKASTKTTKAPIESRRGRGRPKKGTQKSIEQEDEEDEEDEGSVTVEDKKLEESLSDEESLKSKSEDESDSKNSTSKDGGKGRSSRREDDKGIQVLKKYIRAAGIHVKSYNDLWTGYRSNAARRRCLKQLLEKNGITGRPNLEKCKKAKERNERLKDVAELNTSNIISEGRVTRAQRSKDSSSKELTKTSESPTKQRESRSSFKRVYTVVDSDSD